MPAPRSGRPSSASGQSSRLARRCTPSSPYSVESSASSKVDRSGVGIARTAADLLLAVLAGAGGQGGGDRQQAAVGEDDADRPPQDLARVAHRPPAYWREKRRAVRRLDCRDGRSRSATPARARRRRLRGDLRPLRRGRRRSPSRSARPTRSEMEARIPATPPLIPGWWPRTGERWSATPTAVATRSAPPTAGPPTSPSTSPPTAAARGSAGASTKSCSSACARQNFQVACAGITLPNEASVALHESLGFIPVGVSPRIGWKDGRLARRQLVAAGAGAGRARAAARAAASPSRRRPATIVRCPKSKHPPSQPPPTSTPKC